MELQGRQVRLVLRRDQRHAQADVHDAPVGSPEDKPVRIEPMRAFPPIRDLVTDVSSNYRAKQKIQPFTPRPADAP
jgi:succinate dehydrogenase/fumarate reductase-like Fe-S protein